MILEQLEKYSKLSTARRVEGMDKNTYTFVKFYLEKYLTEVGEVNRHNFINWLSEKELAIGTKYVIASMLGKFFNFYHYLTAEELVSIKQSFRLQHNDWSNVEITKDDVVKAIKVARDTGHFLSSTRNPLTIFLMATIGLRVSQLIGIDLDDVIEGNGELQFTIAKKKQNTRNKRNVDIKILPFSASIGEYSLERLWRNYMVIRQDYNKDNALIINKVGNRMTINAIEKWFKVLGKGINIHITPHSLRHYVGHNVANNHGIFKAAALLGHTDIKTTMRYINPSKFDLTEIYK